MKCFLLVITGLASAMVIYKIDADHTGIISRREEYADELVTAKMDIGGRVQNFDFSCRPHEDRRCDCDFGYTLADEENFVNIACSNTRLLKQSHIHECHYKVDLNVLRGINTMAEAAAANGLCDTIEPPAPLIDRISPARYHSNGDIDYHVPASPAFVEAHYHFTTGDYRFYCSSTCNCKQMLFQDGLMVNQQWCLSDEHFQKWKYCIVKLDSKKLDSPLGPPSGLVDKCRSQTINEESSTYWFSDVGLPLKFANSILTSKGPVYHIPTNKIVKVNVAGTHATRIQCDSHCKCHLIFPGTHSSHYADCDGSVETETPVCQLSFAYAVSSFERFFRELAPTKYNIPKGLCKAESPMGDVVPEPKLPDVLKPGITQGDVLVFRVPSTYPVKIAISPTLTLEAHPKPDGSIVLKVPINDRFELFQCNGFKVPGMNLDTYELGIILTDLENFIFQKTFSPAFQVYLWLCQVTLLGDATTEMPLLKLASKSGNVLTYSIPPPSRLLSGRYHILSGEYVAIPNLEGIVKLQQRTSETITEHVATCTGLDNVVGLDSFEVHVNFMELSDRARRLTESRTRAQTKIILETYSDRICRTSLNGVGFGNMRDPLPNLPLESVLTNNVNVFRVLVPSDGSAVRKSLVGGLQIMATIGGKLGVIVKDATGGNRMLACAKSHVYPSLDILDLHVDVRKVATIVARIRASRMEEMLKAWLVRDPMVCQVTLPGSPRQLPEGDPPATMATYRVDTMLAFIIDAPYDRERLDRLQISMDRVVVIAIAPTGKVNLHFFYETNGVALRRTFPCRHPGSLDVPVAMIELHLHLDRLRTLYDALQAGNNAPSDNVCDLVVLAG